MEDADDAVGVVPGEIGVDQRVADHPGHVPGRSDANQEIPHQDAKVRSGDNRQR
jgi:hypothetical protein